MWSETADSCVSEKARKENVTALSAGQQQLLSIARAILSGKNSSIVIMDEPTANIDNRSDEKVQKLIRKKFSSSTLMCIAHRLGTVIDYDRIVVMENGTVGEVGSPRELLSDGGSRLSQMVAAYGEDVADALRARCL